jgi:hypothetical protein
MGSEGFCNPVNYNAKHKNEGERKAYLITFEVIFSMSQGKALLHNLPHIQFPE